MRVEYQNLFPCLVEAAAAQVVRDDHVGDRVEHKLYIVGVGGAGHVTVYLLGGRLVLGLELRLDVRRRLAVLLGAWWSGKMRVIMYLMLKRSRLRNW